ncbi:MAG: hypothetical protein R2789_09045 [Microthrixaceae bacterium]
MARGAQHPQRRCSRWRSSRRWRTTTGGGLGIDRLDGLTVDAGNWWFNLRASTEPLLRLNLEAADEQSCEARVAEVRSVMAG